MSDIEKLIEEAARKYIEFYEFNYHKGHLYRHVSGEAFKEGAKWALEYVKNRSIEEKINEVNNELGERLKEIRSEY